MQTEGDVVVMFVTVPVPVTGCAALNIGTPSPWFVVKPLLYKSAAFCCFVLAIALANPFALNFAKHLKICKNKGDTLEM